MKKISTELIQLPTRNNCLYRRKNFKINSLLILLIFFLVTSLKNNVEAQCGPTVPSFTVDLTGSPDSVWQSPSVIRQGNCCGTTSPDRCVQFLITLDPAAVAINFQITGGAIPPGSLFYQINCGPQITAGQSVCITGVGPHLITFCKPGNNDNQYSITSIPQPIFPPGGTVREGCTKQLEVLGLVENTITWNSIFPGGSGAYNSYLSCVSNCSNPNFTAPVGAPPYIDYRVCGFPIASGCGFNFTVCDTIRVYTATALTGSVTPNPATYCPTSPGINLTASAGGGVLPYQFTWKDGGGVTVGTGTTYFASTPGNYSVHITDSLSPGCPTTIVNVPVSIANISLTPSQVNVSCNGNFDGQASVSATGGTAPYTYLWNNTATTSSISGLPANSFTVTVTDAGGCTASTTINITQPSTLTADITSPLQGSGTNISCNGQTNGEATANGTGGVAPYSYLWNTSATTQTISNLGAGFYQVTITDQNGCTQIDTLTLTEPDTLVVLIDSVTFNSGSTIQCFGSNNGEVTAIVNGGTAPYIYTWSTGATTANIINQPAGPVSIVVEDANGCTAGPVSFIFIQPPPFSTGINSPTYAGGYNISCNGGSDGSVDFTISGASPPYTYLWSNGDTTQDITGVPAGTYTVTATDFNGCTASMTIDLFEPPAYSLSIFSPTNPSGYNIGCNGETNGTATANPVGGTPPYNYNWSTGSFAQTITDLGAGFYEVTVTDANGCILSDTITLTQPDTVVALISSVTVIGGTNASCYGAADASATVTVSGGTSPYSFLWSTGATTDTITGVGAGTITVLVMDSNGCSDDDDFTITEPDSMEASISASMYNGGFNVSCNSATDGVANIFVMGGTMPYSYLWSTGGTNDFINGIGSGIYTITVTDANGCTLVDSITLVQPDPLLNTMTPFVYPSGNNISCAGATDGSINIDITGGTTPYSYIWSHGPTTEDVSGLGIGSYTVTVTDDNGCTVSGTVVLDEAFPAISVTSVTSPTYAGGWNVSCNAGEDGAVNATASGGAPPYIWYWSNGDSTQNISGVSVSIYIVTVTDVNGCTASDSILLTEPALLTSSVSEIPSSGGTGVSCAGGTDGGADLTVNGGTAPYTYLWSTSDTTEDLSNVAAGTYYVTITDANGCTTADTVTISDPSLLTTSLSSSTFTGGNNVSCNGASDGSITLTVGGGSPSYSFQWSNSDTTQNLSGVSAGTYIVTVTDINNCTISDTITLTEPSPVSSTQVPLTYVGGNNVSCSGASDGSIDVTPSGGIGPYTYNWSTTDTSEDLSGLAAGSYTVTVTDVNGCTGEATIVLTEPIILNGVLTSPTFSGGYNVSCGGSDGSINLAVTGGNTAYSYLWSNGETTQNIDSLPAGTYTVTITDANGCTFSDNITLTQPGAYSSAISSPTYNGGYNITCNGANDGAIDLTMSGGTPPYNYIWSTSDTVEDLSGLAPGLYTVTVTDDNNCTITTSITLTEPPVLQSLITSPTNPGGYNISCFGGANGSATASGIDGTPGYTYLWSNGSTSATITNLSIGPHYVTITDANNCTVTDSITLTEPPILAVTSISSPQFPGGWNISCNGGDDGAVNITVVGGAPGYTYNWSNGDTTQNINNVSVTVYIVTVTDVNGCTATNSITLTEPQVLSSNIIPAVTPGGTNISCNGGSDGSVNLVVNGGTAGYTYNWSNGSIIEDPSGLTAGTYYVTITDTNGCVTADTVTLTEPAGMNASTVTSNYNGSGVSCNNACDGNIDLTVSGGASPYTYLWSNNTTGQDLLNICSGNYTVTITDANGCTIINGATITQPAPNTVTPTVSDYNGFGVSCNNNCDGYINLGLSGGTSPYAVSWNTGDTTINLTSLCAGNYSYTVTDANNCSVTNSVTLTQSQPISVTGVTTNSTCNSFCDGTINITPTGGASNYTYSWSSGQATEDITGACAGSYTVTVTDANGCSNSASYNVTEPSPINVTAGVDQFVCGSSASLNANVPASGSGAWTVVTGNATFANANNPFTSVSNLSPGMNTFMWTITDGPCTASASVNIFSDEMVEAIVYPDDTICDDFYTLQAESPTIGNGTWSVAGNSTAVISDPFSAVSPVSGLIPGPNVFIWTVTNGTCTDTARVVITIDGAQQCDSLAMPTGISPNSDGFNDAFVVLGLLRYPDNEFLVFNRWGNEVYYERNYANNWHGVNKSGDNLPDGTYFVILRVFSLNRVLKGYVDIRR